MSDEREVEEKETLKQSDLILPILLTIYWKHSKEIISNQISWL